MEADAERIDGQPRPLRWRVHRFGGAYRMRGFIFDEWPEVEREALPKLARQLEGALAEIRARMDELGL